MRSPPDGAAKGTLMQIIQTHSAQTVHPSNSTLAEATNQYGNIEVSSIPPNFVHVSGKNIGPSCKALGIDYRHVVVGFRKSGCAWYPEFDGLVIDASDSVRLEERLQKREAETEKRRTLS